MSEIRFCVTPKKDSPSDYLFEPCYMFYTLKEARNFLYLNNKIGKEVIVKCKNEKTKLQTEEGNIDIPQITIMKIYEE